MEKKEYIATTAFGLEQILANELSALGAGKVKILNRAVSFLADLELLYKANYTSRTAFLILEPIARFKAGDADQLYKGANSVDWSSWMNYKKTFMVNATVNSPDFNHSGFVALKVKDALVDYFRDNTGLRPVVDVKNPEVRIQVHIYQQDCTISIDSSGGSLHRRGYRLEGSIAPLNEVLAAGMVLISGWNGDTPLVDPMCGSGTILAEAFGIATQTPAGIDREDFGFMHWPNFDKRLFDRIKNACKQAVREINQPIYGFDISEKAIDAAKHNLSRLGIADKIKLEAKDFENLEPPVHGCTLIMNPPYGERIINENLEQFYQLIGTKLKHTWSGSEAWILSGNPEALKHIGLKPSGKYTLYNGQLPCKFQRYTLYDGSRKVAK